MGPIGVVEILLLSFLILPVLVIVGLFVVAKRRARRMGYPSTRAYLRAAPRTDAERRDAADLTLIGVVLTMLGMLFPPVVLVGLVPLFYGGRKLVYASMGLGLVDDADDARA